MFRFDQYPSEEKAYLDLLLRGLKGNEQEIMTLFIEHGPQELKQKLRIHREEDWIIIFDYLVFQNDLLKLCVLRFLDFFQKLVAEKGPTAFRKILGIESELYDEVFEGVFDLVAISHGALFDYTKSHRDIFVSKIRTGKGSELRFKLGLTKSKYDTIWNQIVQDVFQNFGQQLIDERIIEEGLRSFDRQYHFFRRQRGL